MDEHYATSLCRSLCGRRGIEGQTLARELLDAQWAWLLGHFDDLQAAGDTRELAKGFARLCKPVRAIIDGSQIAESELHGRVLRLLMQETRRTAVGGGARCTTRRSSIAPCQRSAWAGAESTPRALSTTDHSECRIAGVCDS
jgi:hypothetical protein